MQGGLGVAHRGVGISPSEVWDGRIVKQSLDGRKIRWCHAQTRRREGPSQRGESRSGYISFEVVDRYQSRVVSSELAVGVSSIIGPCEPSRRRGDGWVCY